MSLPNKQRARAGGTALFVAAMVFLFGSALHWASDDGIFSITRSALAQQWTWGWTTRTTAFDGSAGPEKALDRAPRRVATEVGRTGSPNEDPAGTPETGADEAERKSGGSRAGTGPLSRCRAHFVPLPRPPVPFPSNCSEEIDRLPEHIRDTSIRQHNVMHVLKRTMNAGFLGSQTADPESADLIVFDDEKQHDCYMLGRMFPNRLLALKGNPTIRKAAETDRALNRYREQTINSMLQKYPNKTVLVISDHPLYNTEVSGRNLALTVNDGFQARRPGGPARHIVMPYPAPWNPHIRKPENISFANSVYFVGSCLNFFADLWSGKLLRERFVQAGLRASRLRKDPSIRVKCARTTAKNAVAYTKLQGLLAQSRFCPVLAGDTPSSRRLTDVILAGCIPVFIGPAWHAFPMLPYVKYEDFSVFIRVKELLDLEPRMLANAPAKLRTRWEEDPKASHLVGRNSTHVIDVETLDGVFDVLAGFSDSAVIAMRQAVWRHLDYFAYSLPSGRKPGDAGMPNNLAGKLLLDAVCES